jgi:short-subunit dehydrogenase
LQQELPTISIFPCDLTKNYLEAAEAIKAFRAEGLINNAGVGYYGPLHTLSKKEVEETLSLKITATTSLIHDLIPFWIENRIEATIANISSAAAFIHYPHFAAYSAANRFLLHLSLSLYDELSSHHITSLCFCPGSINTAFAQKASRGFYTKKPLFALSPDACAKALFYQIKKRKPSLLYDIRYRFLVHLINTLPHRVSSSILKKTLNYRF